MRKIARYGYRPDLGDARDRYYQRTGAPLPESVDLRGPDMPPIWDQGQLGSCVWHGVPRALVFARAKAGKPIEMPSRLAGYYETRKLEGDVRTDGGCEIRDAIKVLAGMGDCPETDWPYDPAKFAHRPAKAALGDMSGDVITSYERLADADDYRDCLASGLPFAVGITVYESFESDEVARTGEVPMPGKHEQTLGGHCICVVGYETDGRWLVANSWGTGWGMEGYFHLPAAYLASSDLATDAWKINV